MSLKRCLEWVWIHFPCGHVRGKQAYRCLAVFHVQTWPSVASTCERELNRAIKTVDYAQWLFTATQSETTRACVKNLASLGGGNGMVSQKIISVRTVKVNGRFGFGPDAL